MPTSDSDPPVPATAEQVSEGTASNDDATSAEDPSTPAADEVETNDEDNEAAMEMLPPIAACLPDSPKPVDVPSPVATPERDDDDNVLEESEDLFASQSADDATPPRHKNPPTPEAKPVEATAVEAADTVMMTTTTEVQVPAPPVVVRRVIPIPPAPAQGILKAPSQKIVVEEVVDTTADTVAKWLSKAPKTKDSTAKQKNIVAAAKASRTAAAPAPTTTTTLPHPTAPPTDQTALLAAARLAKVDSLATIALGRNFSKAAAKLTTKSPKPKLVARKTLGTFAPKPPKALQHATPSNGGAARPAKKQKKATTPTSTGKGPPNSLVFEGFPTKTIKDGWPQGWIERRYRRNSGAGAGRTEDSYFFPPGDTTFKYKLRSIPEVKRFREAFNRTKDLDKAWKARKG
jgi:hypothetical protein